MARTKKVLTRAEAKAMALREGVDARGSGHCCVRNGTVTRRREFKPNAISLKTDSHEGEFGTQNPTGLLYNKIQSLYLLAKIISTCKRIQWLL